MLTVLSVWAAVAGMTAFALLAYSKGREKDGRSHASARGIIIASALWPVVGTAVIAGVWFSLVERLLALLVGD